MTPLNLRTLLPFLLVPALLAPAAPALADTYDSGDCRRPPSGVQCREVSGPGEAFAKGALGLGFMHCSSGGLLPVPCSTSGFGGAYFDVSSWNSHPSVDYAREVYLWVNWVGGEVAPSEPGFDVTFCNDRNDDDVCSMPPHQNYDDIRVVQSNAAVLAPPAGVVPGVDFDDHPCDKDSKDCDDPTDAEMEVCVREDDPMDSGFDNIIVFIGAWVDVGLGGNVGVGTYNGIFEVWMREGGFMDPEECPGFVPDEFVFKPYFVD